jgi:murein DD-endopeptidase MepM/ murein hydrolase activator NlpD
MQLRAPKSGSRGAGARSQPADADCDQQFTRCEQVPLHSVAVHSGTVIHKTAPRRWLRQSTCIELIGVRRAALILVVASLALPGAAPAQADYERLQWPLRPRPAVVRGFDAPSPNWNTGHRGVDLAGAPRQPVYAAGSATVVFAAALAGRPVVSLAHHGGLRTSYEPVVAAVQAGQLVTAESVIGTLTGGHPGCGAAACLHWGAMWGSAARADYVDPLGLLESTPIRLKPLQS